jgi:Cro/C1-type HTH DNA-binding domain
MKLGKALRIVMARWQVTRYQLSQASDVHKTTIGKLLKEEHRSGSWDHVEKIANGFEKIDLIAKPAFMGALLLPDDVYPHLLATSGIILPIEQPKNIAETMRTLDELGLLNKEAVQELKAKVQNMKPLTIEEYISIKMQMRRQEEDRDE